MPNGAVRFQGHVLTTGDFFATWAVELAVHHLDVMVDLQVESPTAAALHLARVTVDALLDHAVPPELDDMRTVLLGTGRRSPTQHEAQLLGDVTARLPVLG